MKVYVIFHQTYNDKLTHTYNSIVGIYESERQAQTELDSLRSHKPYKGGYYLEHCEVIRGDLV